MRVVCLVLVIAAIAPHAAACTCPGIPFFDESVLRNSRYHAVFEGVVTDKRISIEFYDGWWVPLVHSEVTVVRVWRGNHQRTILIREGIGGCTGRYSAGTRYLFVADGHDAVSNQLAASACSPTFRIAQQATSQQIARTLGPPAAAFADLGPADMPDNVTEYRFRLRAYFIGGVCAAHNLAMLKRQDIATFGGAAWVVMGIFFAGIVAIAGLLIATLGSRQTPAGWLLFTAGALAVPPVVLIAAGYVYLEHTFFRQFVLWSWGP